MYQGLPLLAKTVHVRRAPNAPNASAAGGCRVVRTESELLALNHPWSPVPFVAYSTQGPDHYYDAPTLKQFDGAGKLHVEVTQQYGTKVRWLDETAHGAPASAKASHHTSTNSRTDSRTDIHMDSRAPPAPRSHAARLTAALGGGNGGDGGSVGGVGTSVRGTADIGAAEPVLVVSQTGAGDPTTTTLLLILDDGPEQGKAMAMFPASESRGGCTLGPCKLGDGAAVMGAINERAGLARRRMWRAVAPQATVRDYCTRVCTIQRVRGREIYVLVM